MRLQPQNERVVRTVPNCPELPPEQKCSELFPSGTLRGHFGTLRSFLTIFLPRVRLRSASESFIVDFTPQNDLLSLLVTDFLLLK